MRNYLFRAVFFIFLLSLTTVAVHAESPTPVETHPVSWHTPYATLDADDFYVDINGTKYSYTDATKTKLNSDPGTFSYTTLEVITDQVKLNIYFAGSEQSWWVTEMRTGNDPIWNDWTMYTDTPQRFLSPLHQEYTAANVSIKSNSNQYPNGTIVFKNLRIKPVFEHLSSTMQVDDMWIVTDGLNPTRLWFYNKGDETTEIDPKTMIPGHEYTVKVQFAIQDTVKSDGTDMRRVGLRLNAGGDAGVSATIPYDLITNHSGGASMTLTDTFTARERTFVELAVYSADNDISETRDDNNIVRLSYPDKSTCTYVQNTIMVVQDYSPAGTCFNLQQAIDAIPDRASPLDQPMYTINIAPGKHQLFDTASTSAIRIKNKGRVLIQSLNGSSEVQMFFPTMPGGVVIDNSHVDMEYLHLYGATDRYNPFVNVINNGSLSFGYGSIYSDTTLALGSDGAKEVSVYSSKLSSTVIGAYIKNTQLSNFSDDEIDGLNKGDGVNFENTDGKIFTTLIHQTADGAIILNGNNAFNVTNNTITNNISGGSHGLIFVQPSDKQVLIDRNIVAFNTGYDMFVNSQNSPNLTVTNNDFHMNGFQSSDVRFFGISSPVGQQGNIDQDPLFQKDYCLPAGSPAMILYPHDFMGHRGPCLPLETITPTPTQGLPAIPGLPSWWMMIPEGLRNFLEQMYYWVFYFNRPTDNAHVLEGVFETPTPSLTQ